MRVGETLKGAPMNIKRVLLPSLLFAAVSLSSGELFAVNVKMLGKPAAIPAQTGRNLSKLSQSGTKPAGSYLVELSRNLLARPNAENLFTCAKSLANARDPVCQIRLQERLFVQLLQAHRLRREDQIRDITHRLILWTQSIPKDGVALLDREFYDPYLRSVEDEGVRALMNMALLNCEYLENCHVAQELKRNQGRYTSIMANATDKFYVTNHHAMSAIEEIRSPRIGQRAVDFLARNGFSAGVSLAELARLNFGDLAERVACLRGGPPVGMGAAGSTAEGDSGAVGEGESAGEGDAEPQGGGDSTATASGGASSISERPGQGDDSQGPGGEDTTTDPLDAAARTADEEAARLAACGLGNGTDFVENLASAAINPTSSCFRDQLVAGAASRFAESQVGRIISCPSVHGSIPVRGSDVFSLFRIREPQHAVSACGMMSAGGDEGGGIGGLIGAIVDFVGSLIGGSEGGGQSSEAGGQGEGANVNVVGGEAVNETNITQEGSGTARAETLKGTRWDDGQFSGTKVTERVGVGVNPDALPEITVYNRRDPGPEGVDTCSQETRYVQAHADCVHGSEVEEATAQVCEGSLDPSCLETNPGEQGGVGTRPQGMFGPIACNAQAFAFGPNASQVKTKDDLASDGCMFGDQDCIRDGGPSGDSKALDPNYGVVDPPGEEGPPAVDPECDGDDCPVDPFGGGPDGPDGGGAGGAGE